jgi:transglutaminase-like putative cysteine protease
MTKRRIPLAPSEGWVTVALVAILCVTVTWAIDDVRLVLGQGGLTDFLMPMALAGMLVGFVGPKVGWGRWTTYLVGAGFAALIVPLVTGSLLRDGSGLAYSMGEWYHATAASAATAVVDLTVENLPYTTQYGHYLLVLGLIVWATSMFASYAVFGHHHPLNAIVALGIVLLVTMSVSIDDQLRYLVVFSIAALLLLIRSHVLEEQGEWIRRRIGDPASISSIYLRGGTAFIVAAVVGSLVLTGTASSAPLQSAWSGVGASLVELGRSWQKYLPAGGNTISFGADFDPSGTSIGGLWNPSQTEEMTITLPSDAPKDLYWRAVVFDQFTGNAWRSSTPQNLARPAGEPVLAGSTDAVIDVGHEPLTFVVTPAAGRTGRLVFSPLTPTGVSQETSVSLIGDGAYLNAIQRRGDGPYTVNALVPVAGEEPGQLSQSALQAAGTEYPKDISIYLQVPEGAIPASGEADKLLQSLKAASPSMNPFVFAQYLTTRFRVNNDLFTYQSNIQDLIIKQCNGISSVECFAKIRVGFCQYYATTMAIFLRASGIPARVVNGFLPGERTKAGVETITNSQSHEWVEVYFPGYGWVMFDPTGGDLARAAPLPSGKPVPSSSARPSAAILPIPSFGDDDLAENRFRGDRGGGPVATVGPFIAITVLLAIIVIALGFVAWQRGPRRGTTADQAYRTVTRIASRFGFAPRPTQTVYEFAGTLGEVLPNARPELETVARAKVETAYGRTVLESDRLQALRDAERRLRVSLLSLAFRRRDRRRRR